MNTVVREIITETLVKMKESNMKRKRAEGLSVTYVETRLQNNQQLSTRVIKGMLV